MKFFVTFGGGGRNAGYGAGGPDASRGALADQLLPLLARIGEVVLLESPAQGVAQAARSRVPAIHLCFALPNEVPAEAGVETWPVFGMGLASCPGSAAETGGLDWRSRLERCGGTLCFSSHAAAAVRALMGRSYAALVVPPPLDCAAMPTPPAPAILQLDGAVLDTAFWPDTGPLDTPPAQAEADEDAPWPHPVLPASPPPEWKKTTRYRLGVTRLHLAQAYREGVRDLLPDAVAGALSRTGRAGTRAARRLLALREGKANAPIALPGPPAPAVPSASGTVWQTGRMSVRLSGVVFAAVHGAWDRSWSDMLSGFVMTCRDDGSATLVIKTAGLDHTAREGLAGYLRRLGPFACRVVILDGAIAGGLDRLVAAARFYVCASPGEASPLPMMRFLAAGRPAVSPSHSALADLVTPQAGFPVASGIEYDAWPGDVEERLGGTGWRLEWDSLCRGIEDARTLARHPAAYAERSLATSRHLLAFCGPDAVLAALSPLTAGAIQATEPALGQARMLAYPGTAA